ncbi:hypothetical protein [Bacillus marasmi]|uniref:hypothetical protein n=1 Tax=Bacillus marasmi TaxID=1926279 RepID=UPI0011CA3F39|nr:hypothetical protein [Bacillus marasmi]
MANEQLQKKFDRLFSEYLQSNNPEILHQVYEISDKLILDEKTDHHLRHVALERLEKLEQEVELTPLLKYRKAVTLFLLKKKKQALDLFQELIKNENDEVYIKDRCRGYLLKYFDDVIKVNEASNYLRDLRKSNDTIASHMREEIEILGDYEPDGDVEDDEHLEEKINVFTSNDRFEQTLKKRISEIKFRSVNPSESYDLFLDLVQQKYFLFGKEISLSPKEVNILFAMAMQGPNCEIQDLYPVIYRERYEYNKQQKDKFQKFTSRFRKNKLAPTGFTFNGTTLPGNYTYCLIYNSQYENTLYDYLD